MQVEFSARHIEANRPQPDRCNVSLGGAPVIASPGDHDRPYAELVPVPSSGIAADARPAVFVLHWTQHDWSCWVTTLMMSGRSGARRPRGPRTVVIGIGSVTPSLGPSLEATRVRASRIRFSGSLPLPEQPEQCCGPRPTISPRRTSATRVSVPAGVRTTPSSTVARGALASFARLLACDKEAHATLYPDPSPRLQIASSLTLSIKEEFELRAKIERVVPDFKGQLFRRKMPGNFELSRRSWSECLPGAYPAPTQKSIGHRSALFYWRSLGESNPCFSLERAAS